MKIPMNRIVKRLAKAITDEIRRGHAIDTTTKLREIIEKTLDFLPEKEKKDTVKKDMPTYLSGTSHRRKPRV